MGQKSSREEARTELSSALFRRVERGFARRRGGYTRVMLSRRTLVALGFFTFSLRACGGGSISVLHAAGKPSGDGPAHVSVKNSSGVAVERLYVAKMEDVDRAHAAPGSEEDVALWGEDQLGNAGIRENDTFHGLAVADGRYDVLVVDHDHREQLVKALNLRSGGKYVLEIGDAWATGREWPGNRALPDRQTPESSSTSACPASTRI